MMSKIQYHTKRAAVVCAAFVALLMLLTLKMTTDSGLIPGLDSTVETQQEHLITREKKKKTVEGRFVDRNGDPITKPPVDENDVAIPGTPAEILFDESYSYLIGYRTKGHQFSGLRKLLMPQICLGGEDYIGAEVKLTTDNDLQEFCYGILGDREGSVIIMEAHTGELLAITSRPSVDTGYDADLYNENYNQYNKIQDFWYNRAIWAVDPPGSTFKIIMSAAMLENGMGDYTYDDLTGAYQVPGTNAGSIHNVDRPHGRGVNMEYALNKSVNVYFASAAVKMPAHAFRSMLEKFQFNEAIVTDFGSFKSKLELEDWNVDYERAQAGFGQGKLMVAPLHTAMVMGTVLNDGVMVVPHVLQGIYEDGGDILSQIRQENPVQKTYDVFSPETAATLKKYLHSTAVGYGYDEETYGMVYAKTGTADLKNKKNHASILIGVESEQGDYVILIDVRNTNASSGSLKDDGHAILNRLLGTQ